MKKIKVTTIFINLIFLFIGIFVAYMFFGVTKNVIDIQNLYSVIDDDSAYIPSPDEYISKKIEGHKQAHYKLKFIEIDNKTFPYYEINEEALKYGIPYQIDSFIGIKDKVEKDIFYCNESLHNEINALDNKFNAKILGKYFVPNFNNKITNFNFSKDFMFKVNSNFDYSNHDSDMVVVKIDEKLKRELNVGNIKIGSELKNDMTNRYRGIMIAFGLLSYLPLFIIAFTFVNIVTYDLNLSYNDIIIQKIFYMTKKKLLKNKFLYYFITALVNFFVTGLLMFLILDRTNILNLIIYLLIFAIFVAIVLFLSINRACKKFYKQNQNNTFKESRYI